MRAYLRLSFAVLFILLAAIPARAQNRLYLSSIGDDISFGNFAILQSAYSRLHITLEEKPLAAGRALLEADRGNCDGLVNRFRLIEERYTNLVRVDYPVERIDGVAVATRDLAVSTPADFGAYRVGIKLGIAQLEKLTKGMPSVTRLSDKNMLIQMLLAERLDVVLVNRHWAEEQIEHFPGSGMRILEPTLFSFPLYHYLNKRHAKLASRLVPILKEMDQSGTSDRLRQTAYNIFESQ